VIKLKEEPENVTFIVGVPIIAAAMACAPFLAVAQSVPLAKIATVQDAGAERERHFFGHVVARQTTDLAFQVGGQVIDLPIVEGEMIKSGHLIAQLDLEPFKLALKRSEAQAVQARRTLERFQQLSASSVSEVRIDDARTELEIAEIAVAEAERALRQATLRAPFDALIALRSVANFSSITPGTPVVRIHDMSELRIEIDVPEILFATVGNDPNYEIYAQFPASETLFPVMPREFNAETSSIGQTFSITLGMDPPEDLLLLPGSSVTVIVRFLDDDVSVQIPQSAVITSNSGAAQVMIFTPTDADLGTVSLHTIKIAPTVDGHINVVEGLVPGDTYVVSGTSRLKEGDLVRQFTGFP